MRCAIGVVAVLWVGLSTTVLGRPNFEGRDGKRAVASQISDGQVQAPPVTQMSDGQPQALRTSGIAATQTSAAAGASITASGSGGSSGTPSMPSVSVRNGTITGLYSPRYRQDFFLGIPYAQPPVNNLRFVVPQSLNTSFSKPQTANAYSPQCVGYGGDDLGYVQSEDCLTLNVIRPTGFDARKLPVAVWFHGGGNVMGGSSDKRYNLSFIVENSVAIGKPMIGVSANYRLGPWGFLYSEEVAGSGNTNLGLRDQRLALHWLQENIDAFGGDPRRVTIWGESAGALDVGLHLVAYGGRNDNLFRAGIMESGNPINYNAFNGTNYYQPLYNAVIQNVSCNAQIDALQCLRTVPYQQLNAVFNNTPYDRAFQPVIDGDFIQRYGSAQLATGDFVKVPIISGANTDEGSAFGPRGINDTQQFLSYLENTTGATGTSLPPFLAQQLLSAYSSNSTSNQSLIPASSTAFSTPPILGSLYRHTSAYAGDAVFIAPRRATCQSWAAHGVSAYCYRFNAIPAGVDPVSIAVTHFQEVAFVFLNLNGERYDNLHGTINPFQGKPPSYAALSRLMASSWASFVHDLDPNSFRASNHAIAGSTGVWPVCSSTSPMDYVFDANVSSYAEPDTFRAEGIALINQAAPRYQR